MLRGREYRPKIIVALPFRQVCHLFYDNERYICLGRPLLTINLRAVAVAGAYMIYPNELLDR